MTVGTDWTVILQRELAVFAAERDWDKYHTPRNLAALIASEAGELLALFRWDQDSVAERASDVRHELADVLLGVLRFADVAGIDLPTAAAEKLEINRYRYPPNRNLGPDRFPTTPPTKMAGTHMKLKYANRSRFLDPINNALDSHGGCPGPSQPLHVRFEEQGGYNGEVVVHIDESDGIEFTADWRGRDESRFPARLKAAATVLRDRKCFGRFRLIHNDGLLTIS